jgi:nicotinamide mononucleotide adenylyltransferase
VVIAILSGRYDIVNPGHLKTIMKCAREVERLIVMVWNCDDKRDYPAEWAQEVLQLALCDVDVENDVLGTIEIVLTPFHFGEITPAQLKELPKHDIIFAANPDVYIHLRNIGANVRQMDETPGYRSSWVRSRIIDRYKKECQNFQ